MTGFRRRIPQSEVSRRVKLDRINCVLSGCGAKQTAPQVADKTDTAIPMKALLVLAACACCLAATPPVIDIKVDQAGYAPAAQKVAMVAAKEKAADFVMRSAADDRIVFRGKLAE